MKRSFVSCAAWCTLLLPLALLLPGCGGGSSGPTIKATPTPKATARPTATATGTPQPTTTAQPTATATPVPASVNLVFSQIGTGAPTDTSPITRADYASGSYGFIGHTSIPQFAPAFFHIQQGDQGYNSGTSANPARVVEVRINAGRQIQTGDVFPIQVPTSSNTDATNPSGAAFVSYSVLNDGTTGEYFNATFTTQGTVTVESAVGSVATLRIDNASMAPTPPQPASFVLNGRFSIPNTGSRRPD